MLAFLGPACENQRMANKTSYFVQAFQMKRGRLAPGKRDLATSEGGAIKKAEAWASREKGTAAVMVTADDETGEVSDAAILGQYGDVPDDFLDQIKGG